MFYLFYSGDQYGSHNFSNYFVLPLKYVGMRNKEWFSLAFHMD